MIKYRYNYKIINNKSLNKYRWKVWEIHRRINHLKWYQLKMIWFLEILYRIFSRI